MNLATYFSADYLFNTPPIRMQTSDKIFVLAALVLIAAAIVLKLIRRASANPLRKQLLERWFNLALTIGILGVIWAGLRYEDIVMLSTRAVILAIYLIGLIWALAILKYTFGKYKEQNREYEQAQLRNRYI